MRPIASSGLLLALLIVGCQSPKFQSNANTSGSQSRQTQPTKAVAAKPRKKPKKTVWTPPFIKYEKPKPKERAFVPQLADGGGIALTCTECNGSKQIACGACEGTGKLLMPTGLQNASGVAIFNEMPCIKCNGLGGTSCRTCSGKGYTTEKG